MEITLDFETMFTGEDQSIAEAVLERCAGQVLREVGREAIYRTHLERVEEIRDDLIVERLTPLIDEALTKSVQKTDAFGEPKGDPTTLREVILKRATDFLKQPRNSRIGQDRQTDVQAFIDEAVSRTVTKELRQALEDARKEVVNAVRAEGAEVIAETIRRMAK